MEENFDNKFEVIYNRIIEECKQLLKNQRKKMNIFLLIVFLVEVIINIVLYFSLEAKYTVSLIVSVSVCIFIFLFVKSKDLYKKVYKENVIKELVRAYNPFLHFNPKMGVSQLDYSASNFDGEFNEFYSEDLIYGTLENGANLKISEVLTSMVLRTKQADGSVSEDRTHTFNGMYGIVRLNHNTRTSVYITNDSITKRFNMDRIEVDSAEFEKYYDCMSKEKVKALQILTPELVERFNNIRRNYKYGFEIKIEDDYIFFRYFCGQIFEPPTFTSGLNKELIKRYYKYIYYPLEVIQKIIENANEISE